EIDLPVKRFQGTGETIAKQAEWWAENTAASTGAHAKATSAETLQAIAAAAREELDGEFAGDVALVTGAAPGSIATALVERLLEGGATVIMTGSRVSQSRQELERKILS